MCQLMRPSFPVLSTLQTRLALAIYFCAAISVKQTQIFSWLLYVIIYGYSCYIDNVSKIKKKFNFCPKSERQARRYRAIYFVPRTMSDIFFWPIYYLFYKVVSHTYTTFTTVNFCFCRTLPYLTLQIITIYRISAFTQLTKFL